MEKDNLAYLRLILDAIRKIQEYLGQTNLNEFSLDGKTQSAVIMQIQVIGELSKKIPDEIKSKSMFHGKKSQDFGIWFLMTISVWMLRLFGIRPQKT